MSLKDKILSAKLKSEKIIVPLWDNVEIEVRELNGGQRAKFMEKTVTMDSRGETKVNMAGMNLEIVLLSCHDPETGLRLFKEEDREALLGTSGEAIDFVAQVGLRLSGLNAPAVETAEKN